MKEAPTLGLTDVRELDSQATYSSTKSTVIQGILADHQPQLSRVEDGYRVRLDRMYVWGELGGELQESYLLLIGAVPLATREADLPPECSVAQFNVILADQPGRGVVVDYLPVQEADSRLVELAEAMQPIVLPVDGVGELRLDRRSGSFSGNVNFGSDAVHLNIQGAEGVPTSGAVAVFQALASESDQWIERAKAAAVDELLALKNDGWLEDGESPVSASEFRERMTLGSLGVWQEGFELCFGDGDLFWGHEIIVGGNLDDGLKRVELFG